MKKIPITQEGLITLEKEYSDLQDKRKDAVQDLKTAREMGDLSENVAYKAARMKLSSIDSRIRHLSTVIRQSVIVSRRSSGSIGIGSKVKLQEGQNIYEYTIVGSYETNIAKGKISVYSPLGKALSEKKAGDRAQITTPLGTIYYLILEVT